MMLEWRNRVDAITRLVIIRKDVGVQDLPLAPLISLIIRRNTMIYNKLDGTSSSSFKIGKKGPKLAINTHSESGEKRLSILQIVVGM